mgnify:CR=1 FL=1
MKRPTKKQSLLLLALAVVILLIYYGQSRDTRELPAGFEQESVRARAEEIVADINSRDYEAVTALTREDLQGDLNAADLSGSLDDLLDKAGEFQSFDTEQFSSTTDRETKEAYASAVLKAIYKYEEYTYTVVLDQKLELVALSVK